MSIIGRKNYVPGYFMIKFNESYGGSFAKRLKYTGIFGYMAFIGISAYIVPTGSAKSVGNESF